MRTKRINIFIFHVNKYDFREDPINLNTSGGVGLLAGSQNNVRIRKSQLLQVVGKWVRNRKG